MDTRQTITALVACLIFFFAYQFVVNRYFPPRNVPTPTTGPDRDPSDAPIRDALEQTHSPSSSPLDAAPFRFIDHPTPESFTLGGGPDDQLSVQISNRGAAVERLMLTERLKNGKYRHRVSARGNEPVTLLSPVSNGEIDVSSFATHRIRVVELDRDWPLDRLIWTPALDAVNSTHKIAFTATLSASDASGDLLRLHKSYSLQTSKPLIDFSLAVESLADRPLTVVLTQDGAVGIPSDDIRINARRIFAAYRLIDAGFELKNVQRDALHREGGSHDLAATATGARLLWAAQTNKYFGVFLRPVLRAPDDTAPIASVHAVIGAPLHEKDAGDGMLRLTSRPLPLPPRGSVRIDLQLTVAPKDDGILKAINPAYVDDKGLNFTAVKAADAGCFCAWEWLRRLMTWLLQSIHFLVRNYGVAIMILVVIVRTCLHPLAVFQQKSMYRMQESMGKIQPRMAAIKEQYANDKVRQNQEIMKLWAEENVNPMAGMVAFIPLFLQMPILIALWTALNTDIHLRNAPFDGYWIQDLAEPDALIRFAQPISIPVLSWLPLLGTMFTNIPSINLLPILMGVSMWLQQKYMPKPAMAAKVEAAKNAPPGPRKPGQGLTPEEQLRQQQMMANMMSIMFPFMFYYMPSGLNLYWMATNVYGICESLIIRKQIEREKKQRESGIVAAPKAKRETALSRFMKRIAAHAEELQKKADQLSNKK